MVREAVLRAHPGLEIEVKTITTSGDRRQEVGAGEGSEAGLKGLFTKEIQEALLEGSIDAAVHSLKDLPGIVPSALGLAAVLPRADASDVLISASHENLDALPAGARVGTGSVRRRRQLVWLRPGVEVLELRGNVPTRLRKLVTERLDGIVLARAGLDRLGYKISGGRLDCDAGSFYAADLGILPAIGQGAICIETRTSNDRACEFLAAADHPPTHTCIRVERELLRLLEGDCQLAVAARAAMDDHDVLHADAILFPDDESAAPAVAAATGPSSDPEALGRILFHQLSSRF
jgi:hydroxymethylbilane synthase